MEYVFAIHSHQIQADKIVALADRLLKIIADKGEASRSDLYNALQRHIPSNDIEAALKELLARRPVSIEQNTEKTGGRDRVLFRLIAHSAQSALSAISPNLGYGPDLSALSALNAHCAEGAEADREALEERAAIIAEGCGMDPQAKVF